MLKQDHHLDLMDFILLLRSINMAKLTASERNSLPESQFAGPDRSYPVPDRSHAVNAKARAQQQYDKGHISLSMLHDIDAKANKVLNK